VTWIYERFSDDLYVCMIMFLQVRYFMAVFQGELWCAVNAEKKRLLRIQDSSIKERITKK